MPGKTLNFSLYVSFLNGSVEESGAILTGQREQKNLRTNILGSDPGFFSIYTLSEWFSRGEWGNIDRAEREIAHSRQN